MRTCVVGDIHGWADRLQRLMERLRPMAQPEDTLVFLGDYVDRGPQSREVVDLVLAERDRWPGPVVALKGNHEAMMLDALATAHTISTAEWQWLYTAEGGATIASYTNGGTVEAMAQAMPEAHRRFYEELALWHEDENGLYVHAGIPPGRHPSECGEEELLWIRNPFINSDYCWPKPVVFGHTPQYESPFGGEPVDPRLVTWRPLNRPEKIGLDTGCAYGGPLTAVILPDREFYDSNWLPF